MALQYDPRTKVHTIQRWIYFRKILLIFEFSRVSKPFFTEQFFLMTTQPFCFEISN